MHVRSLRLGAALFAVSISACVVQASPIPARIGFDAKSFLSHRIPNPDAVDDGLGKGVGGNQIMVRTEVDLTGRVVSAHPTGRSFGQNTDNAIAELRKWRFRPFEWRGKPVIGIADIPITPPWSEHWADRAKPFPVTDANWTITLRRGACFGTCPDYQVTVRSDGEVVFQTGAAPINGSAAVHRRYNVNHVMLGGRHVTHISQTKVAELLQKFQSAHFFGLNDRYISRVTDNPTRELTFASGTTVKTVVDYAGVSVGMPRAVLDLENEVDRVVGTARWIKGDDDALVALAEEGLNFKSPEAQEVLAAAINEDASDDFFLGLLDRGLRLEAVMTAEGPDQGQKIGDVLVSHALIYGRPRLFARLDELGWSKHLNKKNLDFMLALGAACDGSVAKRLVALGADINAHAWKQRTALMNVVSGANGKCEGRDIAAAVQALIDLGVPVNATDDDGETAVFMVYDPDALDVLLKAGAKADVHSKEGRSPAMAHEGDDRVVLTLLEAGADPGTTDLIGQTLRQQTEYQNMPGTVAWLDQHHIK